MAFVMVLSWSRQVFVQFFLDARMESFLRGHIAAFHVWNGLPRILLYDNLLCGAPHKRFYVEHSVMWSSPPAVPCRRGSGAGALHITETRLPVFRSSQANGSRRGGDAAMV